MEPKERAGALLRTVAALVLLGGVGGGYAGFVEILLVGRNPGVLEYWRVAAALVVTYAVVWAAVGLFLGLIALLLGRVRRRAKSRERRLAYYGALLVSLLIFAMVGSYVNAVYLPAVFSRASLLFDAGLAVACVALWLLLFRVSARLFRGGRRRSALTSPLILSALVLVVVVLLAWSIPGAGQRTAATHEPERAPELNILLVVTDALRADHLGCYGYERPVSPNIDRLADGGVLFRHAFSQASCTRESTASLLMSLYPLTHSMSELGSTRPPGACTLMGELKAAGYSTAVLSANRLLSPDFGFDLGVDFFYTESTSIIRHTLLERSLTLLRDEFRGLWRLSRAVHTAIASFPQPQRGCVFVDRDAVTIDKIFLSWLDDHPGPFFAYLHYMEAHAPYEPPPPYSARFSDPAYAGPTMTFYPTNDMMVYFGDGAPISDAARLNMIDQYDASIAYLDWALGELLAELRNRGLIEKTVIILTSDHGEEFYDHSGWGHGRSLYNELIHVPLIVSSPKLVPGGRVVDERIRHIDVTPTLLSAAGMDDRARAPEFEGITLWTALQTGSAPPPSLDAYSCVHLNTQWAASLISERWKIMYAESGPKEVVSLFDLVSDSGEMVDLSDAHPAVTDSMLSRLLAMCDESASKAHESPVLELDEETLEQLRALGYVQ